MPVDLLIAIVRIPSLSSTNLEHLQKLLLFHLQADKLLLLLDGVLGACLQVSVVALGDQTTD